MKRLINKSGRHLKKLTTLALTAAMVLSSVGASTFGSDAAAKPKIGVKVGNGVLIVKKGKSVSLKASPKKATFKSSKPSVIKVNKKGIVKAVKKGSAKITVKAGKKKATITVKTGTPISKVKLNASASHKWSSDLFTLVPNGTFAPEAPGKAPEIQYKKVYPEHKETIKLVKNKFTIVQGGEATISTSVAPSSATYKKLLWKAAKSVVAITAKGTKAVVKGIRLGTTSITVKAKDGSGKKAKFSVEVVSPKSDKTPAPTEEPDTRRLTKVEDFEGYEPNTKWEKYTANNQDQGTMTVVEDPEATVNPETGKKNKCLKVEFNGTNASYDFAPVFNVDLAKLVDPDGNSAANNKLGDYTGVKADIRIVGDHGDCGGEQVKQIYCYFDMYENIKKEDKFAASGNKTKSAHVDSTGENVVPAGDPKEDKTFRFGVDIPHALGADKNVSRKLFNGEMGAENLKNMPCFSTSKFKMDDKSTWYTKESCTLGYKPTEDAVMADGKTPCLAGFTDRYMIMKRDRIDELNPEILKSSKFDVVFGSTYAGKDTYFEDGKQHSVTMYVDNVCMVQQPVAIESFKVKAKGETETHTAEVIAGTSNVLEFEYNPADTTQTEMQYSTNNEFVKVQDGKIFVDENFKFAKGEKSKEVEITVTSKNKPALTAKVKINVVPAEAATEPLVLTLDMLDKDMCDGETKNDDGSVKNAGPTIEEATGPDGRPCWKLTFGANNQRLFFKLPEAVDMNKYYTMEVEGDVPAQMTTEFFDDSFSHDIKTGVVKTADDKTIEWWEAKNGYLTANTYPFFEGSHSERLDDGTSVTKGIEIFSKKIQSLKNEKATKDIDKTRYISLGTNQKPKGKWDQAVYYIYSFKFIPRSADDVDEDVASGAAVSGGAADAK